MQKSSVNIDILLDNDKVPEQIIWSATDSSADMKQKAKAMCLSFWDATDKSALRIDLWSKDMMVDEMGDFYYQILMGMSESFLRATKQQEISDDMKRFAKVFLQKFNVAMEKEQGK